jgi:CHASE2 domain-containing sensor protein
MMAKSVRPIAGTTSGLSKAQQPSKPDLVTTHEKMRPIKSMQKKHCILVMDKINSIKQYQLYLITKYRIKFIVANQKRSKQMNDNETRGMHARMMAEQAVARMNGQLRRRIDDDASEGLVEAILKTGEPDKFLFRPEPFRATPPLWSPSGLIARLVFVIQQKRKRTKDQLDAREALSSTHYKVQRSGAVGLVITLAVSLVVGLIGFGEPAEIALQMARDKARPVSASGDIVLIAQDAKSAKLFGTWPWARRHDAALVDKLRAMGAKKIVFDQIFADPTNTVDDMALAAAFDRTRGKVWLSARFDENRTTGEHDPVLPITLFREKTLQAHSTTWISMFGEVKNIPFISEIDGRRYVSSAAIIAGNDNDYSSLRPDFAINYKSIPTISAADVTLGRIDQAAIEGKTVVIGATATSMAEIYQVLGQGRGPRVYSLIIAAETIKAGVTRELGYILPLLACGIIGIACILNGQRKHRTLILIGGTVALLLLMFVGDRLRLHFEMVPALLALVIMGIRESMRSKVITAMTTNELTGLPNLSHLKFVKGYQNCSVVAIKIERYGQFIGQRPRDEQKILLRAIVARINVIAPDCVIHQGDDGIFVFLVPPDSQIDVDPMPGQLHALFTQDFVSLNGFQRIGISIGINDDLDCTFDVRRAVAIDRAEFSEFVTLQAVQ